jgi:tetratricopeptide (TPR) repeat protein
MINNSLKFNEKAYVESHQILKTNPKDPVGLFFVTITSFYLAECYAELENFQKAIKYFKEVHNLYAQRSEKMDEAYRATSFTAYRLGKLLQEIGNYNEAFYYYDRSLEFGNEISDCYWGPEILCYKGKAYQFMEKYPEALNQYNMTIDYSIRLSKKYYRTHATTLIGEINYLLGNFSTASKYYQESIQMWKTINVRREEIRSLSLLALSQLKEGKLEDVQKLVIQVENVMKKSKIRSSRPRVAINIYWNLAQVYSGLGQKEKSRQYLDTSYNIILDESEKIQDPLAVKAFIALNKKTMEEWEKNKE